MPILSFPSLICLKETAQRSDFCYTIFKMKKQKVSFHASTIYDIPYSFYEEQEIRYLVADLDNTLDSAYSDMPRNEAFLLKDELRKRNIELIVISNNNRKRVEPYCRKLGVRYLASAQKFRKGRILKFLETNHIPLNECLFVGDQVFTDRIYVNRLKGRLILTEPLVKKDQFFTRFIRRYDMYKRRKWKKKNILGQEIRKENS